MNLSEIKRLPVTTLVEIAKEEEIEGAGRMPRHELIFALLKSKAKKGNHLWWRHSGNFTRWFRFFAIRRQFLSGWARRYLCITLANPAL